MNAQGVFIIAIILIVAIESVAIYVLYRLWKKEKYNLKYYEGRISEYEMADARYQLTHTELIEKLKWTKQKIKAVMDGGQPDSIIDLDREFKLLFSKFGIK